MRSFFSQPSTVPKREYADGPRKRFSIHQITDPSPPSKTSQPKSFDLALACSWLLQIIVDRIAIQSDPPSPSSQHHRVSSSSQCYSSSFKPVSSLFASVANSPSSARCNGGSAMIFASGLRTCFTNLSAAESTMISTT
ncbi:unnamed protein product [Vicia faba]|uniref:Uncharacterized protein n=1 Tax=Vicia faba TaxID=3906 RepID=A0AAV1AZ05_VICFA|nr:unnamed protein product [Vicia faba]